MYHDLPDQDAADSGTEKVEPAAIPCSLLLDLAKNISCFRREGRKIGIVLDRCEGIVERAHLHARIEKPEGIEMRLESRTQRQLFGRKESVEDRRTEAAVPVLT